MLRDKLGFNMDRKTVLVVVALALIMALAFFIRVYWAIGPSIQYGYSVSGGSDSYYHERILKYILTAKHQLLNDPMLNYPLGLDNPRPPLFHWSIILASMIFYPFLDAYHSAVLMLILFPAIWGTLTLIPVYLMGREAFGRRVGLVSAFLLSIMPAYIMRSVATQADWDAFDIFFITWMFYFFLKALKETPSRKWIKNWFDGKELKNGLRAFFVENKKGVIYSALAGASLGALGLAWKGYTYALSILAIYLFIQVIVNRFRNRSNFHILVFTAIYTLVGFLMMFPWYYATHRLESWYEVPLIVILIPLLTALYFELTNKYPWPLVFTVGAGGLGAFALIMNIFLPDIWGKLVSGQGYFVHNKLYSTIAEAQPVTMGVLTMSFGIGIFLLSIAGIIYLLLSLRKKSADYYVFIVLYTAIAIFMAISAARFMFNASPAVALTAAVALIWLIDLVDIRKSMEEFKKYGGSWRKSLRKSLKISQITVVLVVALLVIFPTMWSAVDAGIPYETKDKFDKQIYNSMPSFMRPNETTYNKSAPWYLGAFGYSIPKPEYPWQRAWKWLSEQDNSTPPADRPAFVSWWDYGFQAVAQGKHPAIADNFQDGYQIAAQIITAQNESEVISLFIARLLEGDFHKNNGSLSQPIMNALIKYAGKDKAAKIVDILNDPDKYRKIIVDNPQIYGLYSSDISSKNALYVAIKGTLAYLPQHDLLSIYDAIRNNTGWDIRYFAVDYRLFPFSGTRTGIFYAPAKLGDRRVYNYGGTVVPYDFYQLKAVDSNGNTYDLDKIPGNVRIVGYKIIYKPMFYHSMLYRTFIGYSGQDIGKGDGIPGFSPDLGSYQPMQAWNMTHFKLVYKTAYWNPYKDYKNHTKAWKPIPIDLALKYLKEKKGTVELNPPAYQVLPNDVVMVKFYEGAVIEGHIRLATGEPMKHVRVTLFDEYGIPHDTTFTNDTGYFKILSVAGNMTLVVSTDGGYNKLKMVDKTILAQIKINVSEEQAMRLKPNFTIVKNIVIKPANLDGVVYYDMNHNNKLDQGDIKLNNATFILSNSTYGYHVEVPIKNGQYSIKDIPPHAYNIGLIINGKTFQKIDTVTLHAGINLTKDIKLLPSFVKGVVTYSNGTPAANATVELTGIYARYTAKTNSTGSFNVMVVPDNYTLTASKGDYYSKPQDAPVGDWNKTISDNVTLTQGFTLTGYLTYNGEPVRDAVVKVKSTEGYNVYILQTDKNGRFSLKLPGGIYTVYSLSNYGAQKIAYAGDVTLYGDMQIKMSMEKAYMVYGKVTSKDKIVGDIEISAFRGSTFTTWFVNQTGYFNIYLPEGTYSIGFIGFNNSYSPYFSREIVKLYRDVEINPFLQQAESIKGYVYYDKNGNGIMDSNETIKSGLVMLRDSKGYYEVRSIPPAGEFTLGTTLTYTLSAEVYGYHMVKIYTENSKSYIQMSPNLVTVTGRVIVDNSTNTRPLTIRLISEDRTYTIENVFGSYSINVLPGTYRFEISGNNIKYEYGKISVTANVGDVKVVKNLNIKAIAHVSIISPADNVYWYKNGTLVTMGKSVNIAPGEYTVYLRGYEKAALVKINVNENMSTKVNLENGYFVKINQENFSYQLPVKINTTAGNITWKYSTIVLPQGQYLFEIHVKKMVYGNYYLYFTQVLKFINKDTVVILHVSTEKILAEVQGVVTLNGRGVANAVVQFIPVDTELKNVTAITDSAGYYNVKLTPGEYTVYTYYIMGGHRYAYIGSVNVEEKLTFNIEYSDAYLLTGQVYMKNKTISTYVYLDTPYGTLSEMANGSYYFILPSGNYTIRASSSDIEYGQTVKYSINEKISISHDTYMDLALKRNSVHMVTVHVMGFDKYAVPYKSIWVLVKLKNTGNTPEKVKFETFSGWKVINPQTYRLNPGDTKIVSVSLKVPLAKAGDNEVHLRAKYTQFTDAYFHVNIAKYYNTTAKYTLVSWNDNALIYKIDITNNGNTWVNYTFNVLNIEELHLRGWNVEIYGKLGEVNYLNVSSKGKGSIEIRLVATKSRPGLSIPVQMAIVGPQKTITVSMPLREVSVSTTQVYIQAPGVSNYTAFTISTTWYVLWGFTIAIFAAFVVLWRWKK
ncbi:putative membrane protein, required for N-linked glycosylation [Aciduliprofundum sp. MAR08-339]|uniref:carboxypeptidase regulatory-like domain-containing protein n=1 Tax=Aciduliprofundum sp. (strain MAR08-339) TaxID=673860 RepID=UPI0002A495FA|nr:putative membrane protein, required for N-linked glycosylation [Aciduliprofundum sp. MAR08-339]